MNRTQQIAEATTSALGLHELYSQSFAKVEKAINDRDFSGKQTSGFSAESVYKDVCLFQLHYDLTTWTLPVLVKMYAAYSCSDAFRKLAQDDQQTYAYFFNDLIDFLTSITTAVPLDVQLFREMYFRA